MPGLSYMLTHPGFILGIMGIDCKAETSEDKLLLLSSIEMLFWRKNFGADLYKTRDGVTWYAVNLNGFGNPDNYGVRTMMSSGGQLILGLSNPYDGLEMWAGN